MSRDLLDGATPRPWRRSGDFRERIILGDGDDELTYASVGSANAALIVAAVNEYAALLDIEDLYRKAHGGPNVDEYPDCKVCAALARLDAIRGA